MSDDFGFGRALASFMLWGGLLLLLVGLGVGYCAAKNPLHLHLRSPVTREVSR